MSLTLLANFIRSAEPLHPAPCRKQSSPTARHPGPPRTKLTIDPNPHAQGPSGGRVVMGPVGAEEPDLGWTAEDAPARYAASVLSVDPN